MRDSPKNGVSHGKRPKKPFASHLNFSYSSSFNKPRAGFGCSHGSAGGPVQVLRRAIPSGKRLGVQLVVHPACGTLTL